MPSIKKVLKGLVICGILMIVVGGGWFLRLPQTNIKSTHLSEEDQPIQLLSHNTSTINYQKIIIQNPFEIVINFSCDKQTGELLNYKINVISHDERVESEVIINPAIFKTYKNDKSRKLVYKHVLEIKVKKETIGDLELLKEYGFLTERECEQGKKSFEKSKVNFFVRKSIDSIIETLPSIN